MWESDKTYEQLLSAVAVMTAWESDPDNADFSKETLAGIVRDGGGLDGLIDVTVGLQNLCGFLLITREKEQGAGPLETLQMIVGSGGR